MAHLKIDDDIIKKVEIIVKKKNPLRKFKTMSKIVNEALITFILENIEFLEGIQIGEE
ncbi:MAG: hypothetical protein ACP6IY_11055 [Promethearchaeia archaeon]